MNDAEVRNSSHVIFQIIMNDHRLIYVHNCGPERTDMEIRLMYSMAIVRGVNGLVDPSQQGFFADSVMSLASKIGLPSWFVDLRHEATHAQLPSLNILRNAATSLLKWYRHHYWDKQYSFLEFQRRIMTQGGVRHDGEHSSAVVDVEDEGINKWKSEGVVLKGSTFFTNILIPVFVSRVTGSLWSGSQEEWDGDVEGELRRQEAEWVDTLRGVVTAGILAPNTAPKEDHSEGVSSRYIGEVDVEGGSLLAKGASPSSPQPHAEAPSGVIIAHLVDAALQRIAVDGEKAGRRRTGERREGVLGVEGGSGWVDEEPCSLQALVVVVGRWGRILADMAAPSSRSKVAHQNPPPSLLSVWRRHWSLGGRWSTYQRHLLVSLGGRLQEVYGGGGFDTTQQQESDREECSHNKRRRVDAMEESVAINTHTSDMVPSVLPVGSGFIRTIRLSRRCGWPLGSCVGNVVDNSCLLTLQDHTTS
jgi:hypothetical protein